MSDVPDNVSLYIGEDEYLYLTVGTFAPGTPDRDLDDYGGLDYDTLDEEPLDD